MGSLKERKRQIKLLYSVLFGFFFSNDVSIAKMSFIFCTSHFFLI